jgi:hypothetical protein
MRAADFIDIVGVNAHLEYTDGGYADVAGVLRDLHYLGVRHVRDGVLDPANEGQASYGVLARQGIGFTLVAGGGPIAPMLARLATFERANPGAIEAIEGLNEINNWPVSYASLSGTAAGLAYQADLYAAVRRDPVLAGKPVYNLTNNVALAGRADFGNVHAYPKGGGEPLETLTVEQAAQAAALPSQKQVLTETGYYTLPQSSDWGGVDERTHAKLTLNLVMDAARLGFERVYLYQLLDAYPDAQGRDREKHFGLFTVQNQPKPAAAALRALIEAVRDDAPSAHGFALRPLSVVVTGLPPQAAWLTLQKASGAYAVIVWSEPPIWDPVAKAPKATAPSRAVLTLDTPADVALYDPLQVASAIATHARTMRVEFDVTDHPVVLAIAPP